MARIGITRLWKQLLIVFYKLGLSCAKLRLNWIGLNCNWLTLWIKYNQYFKLSPVLNNFLLNNCHQSSFFDTFMGNDGWWWIIIDNKADSVYLWLMSPTKYLMKHCYSVFEYIQHRVKGYKMFNMHNWFNIYSIFIMM